MRYYTPGTSNSTKVLRFFYTGGIRMRPGADRLFFHFSTRFYAPRQGPGVVS
jgi:hypothetical protein